MSTDQPQLKRSLRLTHLRTLAPPPRPRPIPSRLSVREIVYHMGIGYALGAGGGDG